jgi:hypothetical protein
MRGSRASKDEEPAEESEPDAHRHVVVVLDNVWCVVHEHTEILLLVMV